MLKTLNIGIIFFLVSSPNFVSAQTKWCVKVSPNGKTQQIKNIQSQNISPGVTKFTFSHSSKGSSGVGDITCGGNNPNSVTNTAYKAQCSKC